MVPKMVLKNGLGKSIGWHSFAFASPTRAGQLFAWLSHRGYQFDASCSIAGSVAVVEDAASGEDRRLCVCLDGGHGTTLADWSVMVKEQLHLERSG